MAEAKPALESSLPDDTSVICGIIMPISATTGRSEKSWSDVQTLLHRAVQSAGFKPVNVWENSSTDRVSERIVANIFERPLVVADISDLNPNVMLELGMRLASKKPTIVVVNKGGTIPFDIRDFHAIDYPADLNMLGMEDFFRRLRAALVDKKAAYDKSDYTPFLGNVIVDVVSPEKREITVDQLVVRRLDEISSRMSAMENGRGSREISSDIEIFDGESIEFSRRGTLIYTVPKQNFDTFHESALELYEVDDVRQKRVAGTNVTCELIFSVAHDMKKLRSSIDELAAANGGYSGPSRRSSAA